MTSTDPHRVAVLALDGSYPFELGIPGRVFGAAGSRYAVSTCSVDGLPVTTNADFTVAVQHGPELLRSADTIVIPAVAPEHLPSGLPHELAAALAGVREDARIVSICTGAFVLAAAGLLDGRRATTHWQMADLFRRQYPHIELEPDVLFVADGTILTSAGAAAGIDACLHLIRVDFGADVANTVARRCVVPPFREGGQAQYIERAMPSTDRTETAVARSWALDHLHEPITLKLLADQVGMTTRTFTRRFREESGMSPGRWLTQQRIVLAQRLLESTDLPVEHVARKSGFGTGASLRQHLHAAIGVSPRGYRQAFRASAD